MSKQFLAPGGLSAESVQVCVMQISDPGASRELAIRPQSLRSSRFSKFVLNGDVT